MSDPVTATFIGVVVAVFLAMKFWRIIVGVLAATVIAVLILGLHQMITMVEQGAGQPAQSQFDQPPR